MKLNKQKIKLTFKQLKNDTSSTFPILEPSTQSIQTKGSRRKLNAKKIIAHDDVTHGAIALKILKKILDLAMQIKLAVNINATTLKLAEKFDHLFSYLFLFHIIFAQGHGLNAVTVAIS